MGWAPRPCWEPSRLQVVLIDKMQCSRREFDQGTSVRGEGGGMGGSLALGGVPVRGCEAMEEGRLLVPHVIMCN